MINNAETTPGAESFNYNRKPVSQNLTQTVYAGFFSRLLAFGIDLTILAIMLYLILIASQVAGAIYQGYGQTPGAGFALLSILFSQLFAFVYFVYFIANGGQTPGKKALGIKVIEQSGCETSAARAVFRTIGYYISALFFMAGFLWALADGKRQAWHDKLAGTVVVEI